MSNNIEVFKNYTAEPKHNGEFRFIVSANDYISTDWTYGNIKHFSEFFQTIGKEKLLYKILPHLDIPALDDEMTFEEVEKLKSLPNPEACLKQLDKNNLIELAKKNNNEDVLIKLLWLKEYWQKGFNIFLNSFS